LEGPLGARSNELEDQVTFFQFNRDVDDELVCIIFLNVPGEYVLGVLKGLNQASLSCYKHA
jgi:hypothetical protein